MQNNKIKKKTYKKIKLSKKAPSKKDQGWIQKN
jgi:hypothetical protein